MVLLLAFLAAAGGGALVGTLGWVAASRAMSLRLGVLVPPLAALAAVLVSVAVSTQAMYLTRSETRVVMAACAGGALVGVVVALLVSRRVRQLEEDLLGQRTARAADERAEQARRQVVAALTHDLRTPLTGIRAMAEALSDGVVAEPEEYLHRIRVEVDRTSAMVEDLFELARLQAGLVPQQPRDVPVRQVVDEVVAALSQAAAAGGTQVQVQDRDAVGAVAHVDPDVLHRVLSNLVVNAVHAGRRVVVLVQPGGDAGGGPRRGWAGEQVVVAVEDDCGGIAEADLARVFDAGWRGEAARTPGGQGAGLGLAITRELLLRAGGAVSVTNTDGGCRFEVRLPASRRS